LTEDLGLFSDTAEDTAPTRAIRDDDPPPGRPRRRRGRRRRGGTVTWIAVGLVLLVVLAGIVYGARRFIDLGSYPNYEGAGTDPEVVVEVKDGAPISSIARTMADKDVVASARAYVEAVAANPKAGNAQPGFYRMRTRMSGEAAAARILDKAARAGLLEIRGGMRLHDLTGLNNEITPGVLSLIANAACGEERAPGCLTGKQVQAAMEQTEPTELGVPEWALSSVRKADAGRRLEGLIMPGVYHVDPGATAVQALKSVVGASATRLQALGFPNVGLDTGFTPYQILMVSSLVEREGIQADFGKIARVTYNRMAKRMPLQYDSTVNYLLDKPTLLTTDADRRRENPYNTYNTKVITIPPTPIGSSSKEAIEVAAQPPEGSWLYFVKCEKNGTSCFADTLPNHEENKEIARRNGIFG
jgi:UPF0755 protein